MTNPFARQSVLARHGIVVAVLAITFSAGIAAGKLGSLERAIAHREKFYDLPLVAPYVPAEWIVDGWLTRTRQANELKALRLSPQIGTIISARISRTTDTSEPIISLTDADGRTWSLWLKDATATTNMSTFETELPVRSITPY
jgi:hypothetical protein